MTEEAEEVSPVVSRSLHVSPHSLVVVVVVVVYCHSLDASTGRRAGEDPPKQETPY